MSFLKRNDYCPCVSGKKYKNCCQPRQTFLDQIPWQLFDESFVLSELMESSDSFKSFYDSERKKISKEVLWFLNPLLSSKIRCGFLPDYNCHIIQINRLPLQTIDAMDTAQELQHLILTEEGFPGVSYMDPSLVGISAALAGMVRDPLANSRLAEFGFDLWSYYDRSSELQRKNIEKSPEEPSTPMTKAYYVALYLQKSLDWDTACSVKNRDSKDFLNWFDTWYPETSKEAKEFLASVKDQGFETPEKAAFVLGEMLKKYELEDQLSVSFA